jgi:hypothetical protein
MIKKGPSRVKQKNSINYENGLCALTLKIFTSGLRRLVFVKSALRGLPPYGTCRFTARCRSARSRLPLHRAINMSDTLDLLIAAEFEQLVTSKQVQYPGGWERTFEIAPGMKNALQELLYS